MFEDWVRNETLQANSKVLFSDVCRKEMSLYSDVCFVNMLYGFTETWQVVYRVNVTLCAFRII